FVLVEAGPDVADQYIAEKARTGDLAVTQDIPLAAELVPKGVTVINPNGQLYTLENIREKLSQRNFMDHLRGAGLSTSGPKPFNPKVKQQFANAFDRELTRLLTR